MARVEERRLPEDAGREIPVEMEKTYRLLALVRGQTFARPKYVEGDEVMVWPDLVVIEAVSALVFTLLLLAMSILVNAPLLTLANPTQTPNPSKAPWYFLNLQELLCTWTRAWPVSSCRAWRWWRWRRFPTSIEVRWDRGSTGIPPIVRRSLASRRSTPSS